MAKWCNECHQEHKTTRQMDTIVGIKEDCGDVEGDGA